MDISARSFATRAPPTFRTKDAERIHVLQRLAAACRLFGRRGNSEGLLGHITVRDPEHPDLFWVNPVGISMRDVKVSHLVQANHRGEVVHGRGMVNPVGLLLHTRRMALPGPRWNACSIPLRRTPAYSSSIRR